MPVCPVARLFHHYIHECKIDLATALLIALLLFVAHKARLIFSFPLCSLYTKALQGPEDGGGEAQLRLRAFAVCPSNRAPLVLPLLVHTTVR